MAGCRLSSTRLSAFNYKVWILMVCQHIQSEVLIHLVVLEPNNLPLWHPVTKHITRDKMLKVKKQPNYTLLPKLQFKLTTNYQLQE